MSSFCYSHFFSKIFQHTCICISLDVNFNKSLTNDISFEQLGPAVVKNGDPLYKEDNFCDFLFCYSAHSASSEIGSTLKRKNLLSRGQSSFLLTLKMPRKHASENVVCLCCLLNILANFSNLFLHTGKQCGPRSDCS